MDYMRKLKNVLMVSGACISFYIGAGFATMQEIMQYEVSYGSQFPLVILITLLIYLYTNFSFAINAGYLKLAKGTNIYDVYCGIFGKKYGKIFSRFFKCFSVFFCYMSFVVMCGGADATFMQHWGFPKYIGALILAIASTMTVILGLKGIVKSLGKCGSLIIGFILIIAAYSAVTGIANYNTNIIDINNGKYLNLLKQIGGGNPFAAGASYGGFVILWFAAFLSEISMKNDLKIIHMGVLGSAIFIFGTAFLCCLALINYINIVAVADIPALILAKQLSENLAFAFAVIIYLGIYTSAVPLLWTPVRYLANEGTAKYKLMTCIAGVVGVGIACFIPYKGLINILYGINGYLGFLLVFIMLWHDVPQLVKRHL